MDDWAETDLAWELVDIACALMPNSDRVEVYTAIGAGYSYPAIKALLETVSRTGVPVSPALAARLDHWLGGYTRHEDASRLRQILADVDAGSAQGGSRSATA